MRRKKIRELGLRVGRLQPGAKNCITDVEGVKVGHVTLYEPLILGKMNHTGDANTAGHAIKKDSKSVASKSNETTDEYICTGVTAILPHGENLFREKVIAVSEVINGFGKTTGLVQVQELGVLESPIMLTNTFAVPAVTQGTLEYMLQQTPEIGETTGTINIVTGECNDSHLNSIRHLSVTSEHAIQAIEKATNEKVEEGDVGAGKGMVCFGYKGGIGCSSRLVQQEGHSEYTVGALVLSNFGHRSELNAEHLMTSDGLTDGSIMIVLATDAPLSDRQLKRVAKRATVGLGRTGSHIRHGSGDIVIAFSTAHRMPHVPKTTLHTTETIYESDGIINELFTAAAEVTEEAIYNSLSCAQTTMGRKGRKIEAIPLTILEHITSKYNH